MPFLNIDPRPPATCLKNRMLSMNMVQKNKALLLITTGSVVLLAAYFLLPADSLQAWLVVVGIAVSQSAVFFIPRPLQGSDLEQVRQELAEERLEFEKWQQMQTAAFEVQSDRIEERSRDLLQRFARWQEFAEYPQQAIGEPAPHRLTEQDQQVAEILEAEAERVYETIRKSGYVVDGRVDVDRIRHEIFELIQKVAGVYSPNSKNPILETSFEQLARSVSRICLHTLVLMEQLPLEVQRFNINELHRYLQKAVQGYGRYQQIAPWLRTLTRTAYVGRIATSTNPITLGAWWLATEIGRHGTQKLVERVVDRQAIALLHDIIAVIAVEVANVYGPGYRHRDAGWVFATELVELLSRFPLSRDSLQEALRQITTIPLRSEYDRIYLYRCVANHRGPGFRLNDPAGLPREQREDVAHRLEQFYQHWIHGKKPDLESAWREDVESRLDLRLKLQSPSAGETAEAVSASIQSVYSFLRSTAGVSSATAVRALGASDLMHRLPVDRRAEVLGQLSASGESDFRPPDLDPDSELAEIYLQSLTACAIREAKPDENVDALLIEAWCYFRRTREEAQAAIDRLRIDQVRSRCAAPPESGKQLTGDFALALVAELHDGEQITFLSAEARFAPSGHPQATGTFAVLQTTSGRRAILLGGTTAHVVWTSHGLVEIARDKGVFIDDCLVRGGQWLETSAADTANDQEVNHDREIRLPGSLRAGGFRREFAAVLALQNSSGES